MAEAVVAQLDAFLDGGGGILPEGRMSNNVGLNLNRRIDCRLRAHVPIIDSKIGLIRISLHNKSTRKNGEEGG